MNNKLHPDVAVLRRIDLGEIELLRLRRGFTLIEVMVVVAILGILAAIAYPNYAEHMRRSRRADAHAALLDAANRQEQFLLNRGGSYAADIEDLGMETPRNNDARVQSRDGFYTLRVLAPTAACPIATCYVLEAVPTLGQPQTQDQRCAVFTLRSDGQRRAFTSAGNDSTGECW